jgi:hypothetical protein
MTVERIALGVLIGALSLYAMTVASSVLAVGFVVIARVLAVIR